MPKSITPTAREREVYRYFQPLEISGASADVVYSDDRHHVPKSSTDPVLTAFAQLGAHKLHAKRGLVTMSSRDTEYILAEAGVGLSLQQDDDKNDPLWHGTTALKENCGLGMDLVRLFCNSEENGPKYAVFSDLTKEDMFKNKTVVTEAPFVRFLACVPLRSSLYNMVVGTYIVVDDKPREGLTESELEFMIDMGITVMDHLDAQRLNRKQSRAERMVKAIGLFIEGKSSLREWWLQEGHKSQSTKLKKRSRNNTTLEGQADVQFGVQDPPEEFSSKGFENLIDDSARLTLSRSPSSSTLSHVERGGDGRPSIPPRDSVFSSSDTTVPSAVFSQSKIPRNSSVTTFDTTEGSTADHAVRHSSVAFDLPQDSTELSKELQEALLTKDLKAVFARASNLIREAGGVDGSIFFDASIGSFGAASETDVMGQKAPGTFQIDDALTTSDDELGRRSSDTDTSHKDNHKPAENCCNILGFSTRKRSSLRGHTPPAEHHTFPERVLRTLLKRYPHGKVFNFDEDGSFSSSDSDNAYLGRDLQPESGPRRFTTSDKRAHKRKVSREAEAAALLGALPGARSVFWFPLWDTNRERWYAGSLVWSTCPTRILCPIEDLTYLAAFGNSIMAEVARLSALVLTQMKTDFISSISHELRSPLHGVLASVEFLQETSLSEVQADMVSNINASGRVLLDTIDHVLDFSKVNKRVKEKGRRSKRRTGKKGKPAPLSRTNSEDAMEDAVDMCVLSEEVVESVYAGRKLSYDGPASRQQSSRPQSMIGVPEPPVTIIMDIGWRPNWNFEMDAGAWRRIMLNLFGNAMKYTKTGFIKVSLHVEEDLFSRSRKTESMFVLRVKDSGKGISKEFLKHHLYKPFTQEDSLAVGAGLGLSIVRHIIQDLGGEIKFTSEQGVGTEATVKLPLLSPKQPEIDDPASNMVREVKEAARGRTFHLEGFDRYPDISETPTGILSADFEGAMFLKSNIHTMLTDWFDMEPAATQILDKSGSDMVVLMESGIGALNEKLQYYKELLTSGSGPSTAIILCNEYPHNSQLHAFEPLKVFYIPQPYGPHKLAKALHHAFCESEPDTLEIKINGNKNKTPDVTSIEITSPESISLPAGEVYQTSDTNDFATPTQELYSPLSPTSVSEHSIFDRRGSIITDVIKSGGMRVLLVEDNEINLKLLVAYMRKLKLNHATAINGLEALNAYKEANGQFDVIFMDISMPIMSGIESTRHIRRFEREQGLHPVALIALTGAANPNTRQEAFSSGVDLFLTKPVPMKSLKVMLDDLKMNGREGLTT